MACVIIFPARKTFFKKNDSDPNLCACKRMNFVLYCNGVINISTSRRTPPGITVSMNPCFPLVFLRWIRFPGRILFQGPVSSGINYNLNLGGTVSFCDCGALALFWQ